MNNSKKSLFLIIVILLLSNNILTAQESLSAQFKLINGYTNLPEPNLALNITLRKIQVYPNEKVGEDEVIEGLQTDKNGILSIVGIQLYNSCLDIKSTDGRFELATKCFKSKISERSEELIYLYPTPKYEEEITLIERGLSGASAYKTEPQVTKEEQIKIEMVEPDAEAKNESEILTFIEEDALFPGGGGALQKFIAQSVVYPQSAIESHTEGKVYLSFVVEPNGKITHVRIDKGVNLEIDNEAKRLVRAMPNWIPGKNNGKTVRALCRLPINFTLG